MFALVFLSQFVNVKRYRVRKMTQQHDYYQYTNTNTLLRVIGKGDGKQKRQQNEKKKWKRKRWSDYFSVYTKKHLAHVWKFSANNILPCFVLFSRFLFSLSFVTREFCDFVYSIFTDLKSKQCKSFIDVCLELQTASVLRSASHSLCFHPKKKTHTRKTLSYDKHFYVPTSIFLHLFFFFWFCSLHRIDSVLFVWRSDFLCVCLYSRIAIM